MNMLNNDFIIDENYTSPINDLKNNGYINFNKLSDNEFVLTSVTYQIIDVEKTLELSTGEDEDFYIYTTVKELVTFRNEDKVQSLEEYELTGFRKNLYNDLLLHNNERMIELLYTNPYDLEQEFYYFYYITTYNKSMLDAIKNYISKMQEQAKDELEKQVYGGYEPFAWELY